MSTRPPSESRPVPAASLSEPVKETLARAGALLADPELESLLRPSPTRPEIARSRQIFVNRNLRMSRIEAVGFDMDYTLARYSMRRIEQLSYDMTLERLVDQLGYPREIASLAYDHDFVIRGLAVDRLQGNLLKMDRFGHVGRAWHGLKQLAREERRHLYKDTLVRPKDERFAWIDTLFALPEAFLFAAIIELLEGRGQTVDYGKLQDDIRESIDTVHRDGSLKAIVHQDIGKYIERDPELGLALHRLRSGGKKLFVVTNSAWEYTDAVMRYLMEGLLPEYPSWRNYFDYVVVSAAKPRFFAERPPFLELDVDGPEAVPIGEATRLERGRVYQGGSRAGFEEGTDLRGDAVLYVGDHIYGDILKSKKSSLWRTCMIVQELEDELGYLEGRAGEISRLADLEALRAQLDDEVNSRKATLNALERKLDREQLPEPVREPLERERHVQKRELDHLRRALRETVELVDQLETVLEEGFNPSWGLLFKEGAENSRFGEQIEDYACIYTSRVSNLLHASPMQYFRGPRELMPHERDGALSGKLSPTGSEGPPPGAERL